MNKTRGKKHYDQRIATACGGKKHPRVCTKCKQKKRITEFNRDGAGPEGRNRLCGRCSFAYSKNYRAGRRSEPRWLALALLTCARSRAKKDGIAFDLTEEWIVPRVKAGKCEATGLPLKFDGPRSSSGKVVNQERAFRPSIDRIDAGGDYTTGNCRIVLSIYNSMRSNWKDDDFWAVVSAMSARRATETP